MSLESKIFKDGKLGHSVLIELFLDIILVLGKSTCPLWSTGDWLEWIEVSNIIACVVYFRFDLLLSIILIILVKMIYIAIDD
jgi:hypothetical protein